MVRLFNASERLSLTIEGGAISWFNACFSFSWPFSSSYRIDDSLSSPSSKSSLGPFSLAYASLCTYGMLSFLSAVLEVTLCIIGPCAVSRGTSGAATLAWDFRIELFLEEFDDEEDDELDDDEDDDDIASLIWFRLLILFVVLLVAVVVLVVLGGAYTLYLEVVVFMMLCLDIESLSDGL